MPRHQRLLRLAFKATGVFPFNRHAINIPGDVDDKPIVTPTEKLAKRKGIKYIPFYTSPCLEKEIRSQSPEVEKKWTCLPKDIRKAMIYLMKDMIIYMVAKISSSR